VPHDAEQPEDGLLTQYLLGVASGNIDMHVHSRKHGIVVVVVVVVVIIICRENCK
jgi:hypothetical protein